MPTKKVANQIMHTFRLSMLLPDSVEDVVEL